MTESTWPKTGSLVGTTLDDRYEITALVGKGAWATAYLANQLDVQRLVLVKMLNINLRAERLKVQRFLTEGGRLTQLAHPSIAAVYDYSVSTYGVPYLITEHIGGEALAEYLQKQGTLPIDEALDLSIQICNALVAAHARGIIHRDLKPQNIVLIEEANGGHTVKLIDFEMANLLSMENQSFPTTIQTTTLWQVRRMEHFPPAHIPGLS